MSVHELILAPGNVANIYCKDGLTSLDVYEIKSIFNFGGEIKFVNCQPENMYVTLVQAYGDMEYHWEHAKAGSDAEKDFYDALMLDMADVTKLTASDTYKTLPSDFYQRRQILFRTEYRHWCGTEYTGNGTMYVETSEDRFKGMYCPEKLNDSHKLDRNPAPTWSII